MPRSFRDLDAIDNLEAYIDPLSTFCPAPKRPIMPHEGPNLKDYYPPEFADKLNEALQPRIYSEELT